MKIIVIDEEFPYPANTGKRTRSFNLLSRIARNHSLHYLAYGSADSESFEVFKQCKMNPIAVPNQVPSKSGPFFYFRLLGNLGSEYPYVVSSHYSRLFEGALRKTIDNLKPDLIICEWTPYAVYVRHIAGIKKLIVAHNVETNIWQRYRENETNPAKKWYIGKQAQKLAAFERGAFNWVDGATAVSDVDAAQIRDFNPTLPVEVVENGVELEYFRAKRDHSPTSGLVFVGTMDWRPNQDAVVYFVKDIFPALRKRLPDVEAVFVGRKPPRQILDLNRIPGVTVTGSVDDVRPYMDAAAVYIVPLRIGGGTRLKILDALAMEKPVVSTSVGAEGLDVTPGTDILLADTPEEFVSKIEALLQDPQKARSLGEKGRQLVEERYGWDRLARKLEDFLVKLTGVS